MEMILVSAFTCQIISPEDLPRPGQVTLGKMKHSFLGKERVLQNTGASKLFRHFAQDPKCQTLEAFNTECLQSIFSFRKLKGGGAGVAK